MDDLTRQQQLIANIMAQPHCLPQPADNVERLETHLSTVLLAGDHAYKIKKPLDLGFANFSTLAQREQVCNEEIRLNQRLAPDIYQQVVTITGNLERPEFNGDGEILEYAVMMRRFPQSALLDHLLEKRSLPVAAMDALGERLGAIHASAPQASADSPYGQPKHIGAPMLDNFSTLNTYAPAEWDEELKTLFDWTQDQLKRLAPLMEQRARKGFIRECHGDLHLGNILQWHGEFVLFDSIEFDPGLRWIDLMSDLAFALMDLESRGAQQHARRLKNAYLETSGDYQGLALLRLYLVYRAMVRAKIAMLRAQQFSADDEQHQASLAECRRYIELGLRHCVNPVPVLAITCGCSGSGKSTAALQLVDHFGFIRIRSDVERKRLLGLAPLDRAQFEVGTGAYDSEMTTKTYQRLLKLAEDALTSGERVIIDAAFLSQAQRQPFQKLAAAIGLELTTVVATAAEPVLRARVGARALAAEDPSDATLAVLAQQLRQVEWPKPEKEGNVLRVLTDQTGWETQLLHEFTPLIANARTSNKNI